MERRFFKYSTWSPCENKLKKEVIMTIKCKAAVIRKNDCEKPYANSKPLSIEEISIDNPRDNEVLVKVKGAGLCHSDLSVINGSRIMPLPLVIGHEGSGEVVETGNAINDVKVGDHVVFQFSPSCGRCRRCLEAVSYTHLTLPTKQAV